MANRDIVWDALVSTAVIVVAISQQKNVFAKNKFTFCQTKQKKEFIYLG